MTNVAVLLIDVAAADAAEPAEGWSSTIRRSSPDAPTLLVTDLAAIRGDGIFETLGVLGGHPQQVEPHLARLAHSAAMLDLPAPNAAQWRAAIAAGAALLPDDEQGGIKLVLTRGPEGTGVPTAWVMASTAGNAFESERTNGLRVALLDRGYDHNVAQTAPWLLAGAKTLSYAVNMAAQREARRRGADDALFVSSDGYVLEAPTSTLIARFGDRIVTPRTDIGILAGTSQLSVFDFATSGGLKAEEVLLTPDELRTADAAWLVSSVRLAAPIIAVDDTQLPLDRELTDAMNTALLAREV
jgi:4-amino-4-deoxychorismate lyase